MAMSLKLKLKKEISQVIFRPTIPSAESFLNVVKNFEPKFKEWVTKNNTYTLYSPDNLEAMLFNNYSITFGKESHKEADFDKICSDNIITAFKKYKEDFKVKEIRRIGYGIVQVLEADIKYSELCDLVYKKFYSKETRLKEISYEKNPRDVIFILDGEKDKIKNHVEIGPTNQQESLKRFNSGFTGFETKLNLKESNIYIAVDSFVDGAINLTDTNKLLVETKDESKRIVKEYIKYFME